MYEWSAVLSIWLPTNKIKKSILLLGISVDFASTIFILFFPSYFFAIFLLYLYFI